MKNISFKLILFIAFLFLGIEAQAQSYFYVDIDAPAGGNGLSWSTAFNNLQDGIDNAATAFVNNGAGIVRVSDGMYPTVNGFQLKNGVQIWGGYNARSAPDWLINATRFFNGAITIIGPDGNTGSTRQVQTNLLTRNRAFVAGEDLCDQTMLNGLRMSVNMGIRIDAYTSFSAKIINCIFDIQYYRDNTGGSYGISGQATLFNPIISECDFLLSYYSTAISITGNSFTSVLNPIISKTTFKNSQIRYFWHHMQSNIANITFDRCEFIDSDLDTPLTQIKVSNSTFFNLNPVIPPNAFYQFGTSSLSNTPSVIATNCTFFRSRILGNRNETFENCIFRNITYPFPTGIFNFKNCLFDYYSFNGNLTNNSAVNVTNAIIADPQFVTTNPVSNDFLKISTNSPARNAGNNSFIPVGIIKGYGGNSRILERTVDIGAYEFCPSLGACRTTTTPQGGGHTPSRKMTAAIQNSEINSIVYPNPATNVLNIKSKSEIISISLLNVQGQEVKKWNTKNKLYIGDLPIGMYLLKVNTTERIEHIRIIKE
ncbi:T9SS type A sorting domain-containing protein [Bernardetia sp. OM2101]|uniref:T9SS type A sorting domain-containing protein n=1 Tax=Bernardetia sp. OM2101 TaxID=3344876 RepID=UPI0035D13904